MKTRLSALQYLTCSYGLLTVAWLEQLVLWFLALGVDWTRLPLAFAGATIATAKSMRNSDGTKKHVPPLDWIGNIIGGTVIAMVFSPEIGKLFPLLPLLVGSGGNTFTCGLLGWWIVDILIGKAKKQLTDADKP